MPLRTTTPLLALLAFALLAAPQLHAQDARPSLNVGYYEFPLHLYRPGWPRRRFRRPPGPPAAGAGRLSSGVPRPAQRAPVPGAAGWQRGAVGRRGQARLAADTLQARRVLGHVSLNLYYPAHQPAPRVPQDLAGRRLILISGYSYWKPVTDFIQDPNLHLRLYRTGTHHAALRMLELGRGDYLLDYQAPVEAASRQALASQELYRLPLRMIVSRHIPGAEALRDRLDQAYDQLRSDGADLSLL